MKTTLLFILISSTFFSCKRIEVEKTNLYTKEELQRISDYNNYVLDTIKKIKKEKEIWKIIRINRRLRYYDNIIIENQNGETKHIRERNASIKFKVGDIYND